MSTKAFKTTVSVGVDVTVERTSKGFQVSTADGAIAWGADVEEATANASEALKRALSVRASKRRLPAGFIGR